MDLSLDNRLAGVLVPVFAIRGKADLGIGDTESLMEFIDWAAQAGFGVVKILPINETGGDNSPYNAISSVAIEPATLCTRPGALEDLSQTDFDLEAPGRELDGDTVDYRLVKDLKRRLLERAFERFRTEHLERGSARAKAFADFLADQGHWLEDYMLFRVLMDEHGGNEQWSTWPAHHRSPEATRRWLATEGDAERFTRRMRFFGYVQWQAFEQWRRVKAHAEKRGVALMGDIPFGISFHSVDLWGSPQFFRTDWFGGTPPDRNFKHDPFVVKWGQNWGIPLYDWKAMLEGGKLQWWSRRVHGVREFFDLFRIDHILGFYRIYGFPWRPEENGKYLPLSPEQACKLNGPDRMPRFHPRPDDTPEHKAANRREGETYLRSVLAEAGAGRVIGEDLGEVPDYVRPSLHGLGIAGYKVPQWERIPGSGRFIPGTRYERLSLAMYGTHDHDPLEKLWEQLSAAAAKGDAGARREQAFFCEFASFENTPPRDFSPALHTALVRALFASNSWIAVLMVTDVFARGERFNLPGVSCTSNWTQRMHAPVHALDADPAGRRVIEVLAASGRVLPGSRRSSP